MVRRRENIDSGVDRGGTSDLKIHSSIRAGVYQRSCIQMYESKVRNDIFVAR